MANNFLSDDIVIQLIDLTLSFNFDGDILPLVPLLVLPLTSLLLLV